MRCLAVHVGPATSMAPRASSVLHAGANATNDGAYEQLLSRNLDSRKNRGKLRPVVPLTLAILRRQAVLVYYIGLLPMLQGCEKDT